MKPNTPTTHYTAFGKLYPLPPEAQKAALENDPQAPQMAYDEIIKRMKSEVDGVVRNHRKAEKGPFKRRHLAA